MFKDKFKEFRNNFNYSQEEIADMIEVSANTVSGWESGRLFPSQRQIEKIENCFGNLADWLFSELIESDNDEENNPHLREGRYLYEPTYSILI